MCAKVPNCRAKPQLVPSRQRHLSLWPRVRGIVRSISLVRMLMCILVHVLMLVMRLMVVVALKHMIVLVLVLMLMLMHMLIKRLR